MNFCRIIFAHCLAALAGSGVCGFASELETQFGRSSNVYSNSRQVGGSYGALSGVYGADIPTSQSSRYFLGLGGSLRQYVSETEANATNAAVDAAYTNQWVNGLEFRQRLTGIWDDSPNFSEQRLTSYQISSVSRLASLTGSTDIAISLPISAKFFRQRTKRRAGPDFMFAEPFREDFYTTGIDLSARRYFDSRLKGSALFGFSTQLRNYLDKPVTRNDGPLFESSDSRSKDKARELYSNANMDYKYHGRQFTAAVLGEIGYNHDLQLGSEDYVKYAITLVGKYSTRILDVSNLVIVTQKNFPEKIASLERDQNSPNLQIQRLKNDFRTTYSFTKAFDTGGGFRYEKLLSNLPGDTFSAQEFYIFFTYLL